LPRPLVRTATRLSSKDNARKRRDLAAGAAVLDRNYNVLVWNHRAEARI
jgi:hypothetical protein